MRNWFRKLLRILEPAPERVRRIEVYADGERVVLGSIWKTTVEGSGHLDLTYYSVTWDDQPSILITIPSTKFIWFNGMWTLLGNQKNQLAGRKIRSPSMRSAEKL